MLWNDLSQETKLSETLYSFKRHIYVGHNQRHWIMPSNIGLHCPFLTFLYMTNIYIYI